MTLKDLLFLPGNARFADFGLLLLRIAIGVFLIIFGILGFLPVLGFWMIPLGLLILSYEFARVRRWRRRTVVWWQRRRR